MTNAAAGWYPDPSDRSRLRWWNGESWTGYLSRDGVVTLEPAAAATSTAATTPVGSISRVPIWVWALVAVVSIVLIFALSQIVALAAFVVLVTGLVALGKGTPTWLRISTKRTAGAVVAASAVVLLVSGSVASLTSPKAPDEQSAIVTLSDASSAPAPTATAQSTWRDEEVTETIPFEQTTIEDPALTRGQTQITTVGQAGVMSLTYRVELKNGREVGRELLSEIVTTPPVTQVTSVGTYDPPPPPPAAVVGSGCDPNYADGCVPVSSDVDCAWGSGNGPSYFDGVAVVVGSDIYDLDRDGDGYACEQ